MYYAISKNGKLVGVTTENAYNFNLPDVSIHEFDGPIPDLNSTMWDDQSETLIANPTMITKLAFLNRFTLTERMAIRSSTDPIVADIMNLLEIAEYVNLTDPNTTQGVGYLAMVGVIAPNRVTEITS